MKLLERYVKKINISDDTKGTGFNWLNSNISQIPQSGVKKLQFSNLYASLICGFIELDWHKNTRESVRLTFDGFRDFFNKFQNNICEIKKNKALYTEYKTKANSFYGKLDLMSLFGHSPNYSGYLSQYLKFYYIDLIERNKDKILYIDTDQIFYKGEIDLLDFPTSYELENIDYVLFAGKKKFVYLKENKINISRVLHWSEVESDNCAKRLKSFARQDKIDRKINEIIS
jgi:hypothetical protein